MLLIIYDDFFDSQEHPYLDAKLHVYFYLLIQAQVLHNDSYKIINNYTFPGGV